MSPLGALVRGVAAGVAGTAAMTLYQEAVARVRGGGSDGPPEWKDAPAPAQVARKVLEGVFDRPQPPRRIPLLTNAMHWGYGTAWGAAYGLLQATLRAGPGRGGLALGTGVWASSYAQLVPLGIYEPPWRYSVKTLAVDLSYHLVYGFGVAAAFDAVDRAE